MSFFERSQREYKDVTIPVYTITGQAIGQPDLDELRHALTIQHPEDRYVILDLEGMTWINSTGINVLISAHIAYLARGGNLVMDIPETQGHHMRIRSIFEVTRLLTVFDIQGSLENALEKAYQGMKPEQPHAEHTAEHL